LSGVATTTDIGSLGPDSIVFGIGNCARADDGLGWAFLDRVRREPAFDARTEYRYQLQVEDAALVREADTVVFVDACHRHIRGGFRWGPCEASRDFRFDTHRLEPPDLLALCRGLFGKAPPSHLLLIQGSAWGLRPTLSEEALERLERAVSFFGQRPRSIAGPRRSPLTIQPSQT
jgi:hydrogenase maturation protease